MHACGYRHWSTVTVGPTGKLEVDNPPKRKHGCRKRDPLRMVGQFDVSAFDGWYE